MSASKYRKKRILFREEFIPNVWLLLWFMEDSGLSGVLVLAESLICTKSVINTLFVFPLSPPDVNYSCVMKRSSQESKARLFAVAESQGGYFTAKQAEESGFDRTNHAYHVRAGNWEREYRVCFRAGAHR